MCCLVNCFLYYSLIELEFRTFTQKVMSSLFSNAAAENCILNVDYVNRSFHSFHFSSQFTLKLLSLLKKGHLSWQILSSFMNNKRNVDVAWQQNYRYRTKLYPRPVTTGKSVRFFIIEQLLFRVRKWRTNPNRHSVEPQPDAFIGTCKCCNDELLIYLSFKSLI